MLKNNIKVFLWLLIFCKKSKAIELGQNILFGVNTRHCKADDVIHLHISEENYKKMLLQNQSGGNDMYDKYLKYKSKYMLLINNIEYIKT